MNSYSPNYTNHQHHHQHHHHHQQQQQQQQQQQHSNYSYINNGQRVYEQLSLAGGSASPGLAYPAPNSLHHHHHSHAAAAAAAAAVVNQQRGQLSGYGSGVGGIVLPIQQQHQQAGLNASTPGKNLPY